MKKKLSLILMALVLTTITASAYFSLEIIFDGKVGTYPITGDIVLGNGGDIWGSYGYKKNGNKPKAYLDLKGEWESISSTKYRVRMTESSNGSVTGSWNVVFDESKRTLSGTMTTGGKTYKVNCRTRKL